MTVSLLNSDRGLQRGESIQIEFHAVITIELGTEIPIETCKCGLLESDFGGRTTRPTSWVDARDQGYAGFSHRSSRGATGAPWFTSKGWCSGSSWARRVQLPVRPTKKPPAGFRGGFIDQTNWSTIPPPNSGGPPAGSQGHQRRAPHTISTQIPYRAWQSRDARIARHIRRWHLPPGPSRRSRASKTSLSSRSNEDVVLGTSR